MSCRTGALPRLLSVMALEDHGLVSGNGPVLVYSAAGGVGRLQRDSCQFGGNEVCWRKPAPGHSDYLNLSASSQDRFAREELKKPSSAPLEAETWARLQLMPLGARMLAGYWQNEIRRLGRCCWSAGRGRVCLPLSSPFLPARCERAGH